MSNWMDIVNRSGVKATWAYAKDQDWPNDRIIIGPFTSPAVDLQNDNTLLTDYRLKYIFNYGHLIKEHHRDKGEPVIIEGDCLAIGYDDVGKTYGVWGFYDGTETIDEEWQRVCEVGKNAGFSIGGKIPTGARVCNGKTCQLIDPEVLEVSWTKYPANQEATVYYVNQFAKSVADEVRNGADTYEIKSAQKRMEKRLLDMFTVLPEEEPDYDKYSTYPCVKDYTLALIESGKKRAEAEFIVGKHIENIRDGVLMKMEQTEQPIEKEENVSGDIAPAPTNQASEQGNKVLELLEGLLVEIKGMRAELDLLKPKPEPEMPAEPEPEAAPPAKDPEPESTEKSEDKPEENKPEDEKDEEVEKSEEEKPEDDKPESEDDESEEKGCKKDNPVQPEAQPAESLSPAKEPMKKSSEIPENLILKPTDEALSTLLKSNRLQVFRVSTRPEMAKRDPVTGLPLKDQGAGGEPVKMKRPTELMREQKEAVMKMRIANAPSKIQTGDENGNA